MKMREGSGSLLIGIINGAGMEVGLVLLVLIVHGLI